MNQGNCQDKQLICDSILDLAYDHGEEELCDLCVVEKLLPYVDQVKAEMDHADVKENKDVPKQIHEEKLQGIKYYISMLRKRGT